MKDINISKITPSSNPIYKGTTHYGRPGFILDVTYTLADGREVPTTVCAERKKDVLPALQREIQNAANGSLRATLSEDGEFWGTVCKFTIGAFGMVPLAGTQNQPA